jgi:hypothetical protein
MEVYEAYKGMYDFKHLPLYARFLLNNRLANYADEQIRLSQLFHLPILASLHKRFSDEELRSIAVNAAREYLEYIASNRGREQIVSSMNRWMDDQLKFIGQSQKTSPY